MFDRIPRSFVVLLALALAAILAACGGARRAPEATLAPPTPAVASPAATATPADAATRPPEPTRVEQRPTAGATGLTATAARESLLADYPSDRNFTVYFSRPMDPASANPPLIISPLVRGTFQWEDDNTTLVFAPTARFAPKKTYQIRLADSLASATGEAPAPAPVWELTVAPLPTAVRRDANTNTANRTPEFLLRFSREMHRDDVGDALRVTPAISLTWSWAGNDLTISPAVAMEPGVQYDFRLDQSLTDLIGVPLASPISWRFRPAPVLADPIVARPGRHDSPVQFRFNYAMDTASVEDALRLQPALSGRFTWSGDGKAATFYPDGDLLINVAYTVTFAGTVRDAAGDPFPALAPLTFTTPTPLSAYGPTGGSIHPATPLRVTFERAPERASAEAGLSITPAIDGSLSWEGSSLVFVPADGYFVPNTGYTVALADTIRDEAGRPMLDRQFVFSFRTTNLTNLATFGDGIRIQVLDLAGRRAIHFNSLEKASRSVAFDLYALTEAGFRERYPIALDFSWGVNKTAIDNPSGAPVASWRMATTAGQPDFWLNTQETILPDGLRPGFYLLNMSAGSLNDQLLLVLSHYTIGLKQDARRLTAWVTDIAGAPAAGASVSVVDDANRPLGQGITDADGVARIPLAADAEPYLVFARVAGEITMTGLGGSWQFGGAWWWGGEQGRELVSSAYVFTDRPIYRPGQTVYFKAIVRDDDDAVLTLPPAGTAVTVRIRDTRNNIVQTSALQTNDFGTAHGEFAIAEGAMLGLYRVELDVAGDLFSQPFKVEEYRKPDYAVTVSPEREAYVVGDRVTGTIEAAYYFGEPVGDAQATLNRYSLGREYVWTGTEAGDAWFPFYDSTLPRVTLDAQGRASFTVPAEMGMHDWSWGRWNSSIQRSILAVEATVDDGSRQTVSGYGLVYVYNAEEEILVDTGGYTFEPGETLNVRATVRDIYGETVPDRALTLSLGHWSQTSYGYSVDQTARLRTDAAGVATTPLSVATPGYYNLVLEGQDRRGNSMRVETWLYVFGDFYDAWFGSSESLKVVADRTTYAPGDAAELTIESSFDGPALITFERGTVRREQLIRLTPPITRLAVPVQADDVPNIHVTVNAWRPLDTTLPEHAWESIPDAELLRASVNLDVPATDKVLTVLITPDRETYAPRDQASFTIRVTNYRDEPVSAEVSLAVVDEAIFALSKELSGPIYEGFYFLRDNRVVNHNSLAPRRFLGGGGGGGGGGEAPGNPRQDLPDTAFWFPVLRTDANGEVAVTVTLPDNVTSWRLTSKAVTADTQVGETVANITVTKPVIVRPILPRTLTAGDQALLSALVHNFGEASLTLSVQLDATNAASGRPTPVRLDADASQSITLRPGEVRVVGWPVTAVKAGPAAITVWATYADGAEADAVRLPLEIRPLAVPDVTTLVGEATATLETTVDVPAGALDLSTVTVELSTSLAGTLVNGLDYLTGFPYGCVEQTMSRALPNAVVARAFSRLGMGDLLAQADLDAKIEASIQRLYGFQHDDGGWGWWFDDATDAYQTAWVMFGLSQTRDAGYEVDESVLSRGAEWLRTNLATMDARTRVFALYSLSLAGYGERDATLAAYEGRAGLDTFSQAALALTLHALGQTTQARALVSDLSAAATTLPGGKVTWSAGRSDGYYDLKTMASSTRTTAMVLSALVRVTPGSPLEAGTVRWLMGERRLDGWGTTNETAFAVLGLTDHLVAQRAALGNAGVQYSLSVNGQTVEQGTLAPDVPLITLAVPFERLRTGANTLRLTHDGRTPLYYALSSRMLVAQEQVEAAGPVTVNRVYLDAATNQILETVAAGQLVRVRLTVNLPARAAYVIVEDSLPGGLEALNEGLNTENRLAASYGSIEQTWRGLGYNYKEIRDDRVAFFITDMNAGRTVLTYYARATHAGTFMAMPTEVSAMYDLATWGRSASTPLVVD